MVDSTGIQTLDPCIRRTENVHFPAELLVLSRFSRLRTLLLINKQNILFCSILGICVIYLVHFRLGWLDPKYFPVSCPIIQNVIQYLCFLNYMLALGSIKIMLFFYRLVILLITTILHYQHTKKWYELFNM